MRIHELFLAFERRRSEIDRIFQYQLNPLSIFPDLIFEHYMKYKQKLSYIRFFS